MSVRGSLVAYLAPFVVLGGTSYAAVGAAAVSAGGRAAAAPAASRGCYPQGTTTVAQDKVGRFYQSGAKWYVCAFRQGTPHQAYGRGPGPISRGLRSATVSGRYLAFSTTGGGGSAPRCCGSVIVIDMLTGHEAFRGAFNGGGTAFGGIDTVPSVLVLKPNGFVAWIYRTGNSEEVHRRDSTGAAIIDSGPQIDPHSLAAGGSWLYWTDDGSPRSAPFH